MLSEIRIQNFAIIDKLEVILSPGFNVITGETGAGKSIIIDAVDMMLGGRADTDFIRGGSEKSTVEGVFKLSERLMADLRPMLDAEGIELTAPDELTFTREIRSNGRNTARVNGSTVSLQFFRDLGQKLVDIHGQTDHLSLLRPREHLFLLDNYAGLDGVTGPRADLAALVAQIGTLRQEIDSLEQDEAAIARRIDMLNYQIEEIRGVNPKVGEEEALKEESTRLSHAEQLAALMAESMRALEGDETNAIELLNQAAVALAKVARIDSNLQEHANLAESLSVQAEEMARSLEHYAENIEHNPARLNEVEDRLDAINRLKRKYGGSVEAVLEFQQKAQQELETITHSEERLIELRDQEDKLLHQIGEKASKVSTLRYGTALKLAEAIESELADLRMEGTRFQVQLEQDEAPDGCYVGERRLAFDSTGFDRVEFLIAANRGEPLRPLVKVASGGETARLMLALKSVLSRADKTPSLIFDEIDQGIGGRVGTTVGQKLWRLSEAHQVLCVTHMAQLAGFADAHFKVSKATRGDRTVTTISNLDGKMRVNEIAEMLGADSESNRQSAQDILNTAHQIKEGKGLQQALM